MMASSFGKPRQVRQPDVQVRIAAGDARGGRERQRGRAAVRDHAPLGAGQRREPRADRLGQLVEVHVLLRGRVHRRPHLRQHRRSADDREGAAGVDAAAARRCASIDGSGRRRRLAALTGAEWGLVTSGCAAALTHATAACVAGGNPDLHIRIPNLAGFAKDEVIIPAHSRNVYEAAVRACGVRVLQVSTIAELEAAFGPRTAMVYILAGPAPTKARSA